MRKKSLGSQINEWKRLAESTKGDVEKVKTEKNRKVQFLEQENLQLMVQLKSVKKELQNTRAKNNAQGSRPKDDCTEDFTGVTSALSVSKFFDDKENIENFQDKSPLKGRPGKVNDENSLCFTSENENENPNDVSECKTS